MRAPRQRTTNPGDEGYLMVMMGLLIIPFIIFTAIAVDVSSWYSRATELQRAADAAALAGVVEMPRLGEARRVAGDALQRNGLTHGDQDVEVDAGYGAGGNSFRVCVSDTKVTQFFGAVIGAPTSLTRCATAQYNLPLEIGSPQNYFGGIRAASSKISPRQNPGYWASIEALGTDAVQGDRYMPKCYGRGVTNGTTSSQCGNGPSGTYANPEFNWDNPSSVGHYYTLKVTKDTPTLFLQAFSPRPNTAVTGDSNWNTENWEVHYRLYAPDDTPWDPTDNPPVSESTCGGNRQGAANENSGYWVLDRNTSSNFSDQWRTLCTMRDVPATAPGKPYILKIWAEGDRANASNSFALRATASEAGARVPTSNHERQPNLQLLDEEQPALAAWQHMAITVRQNASTTGGKADFFLAKVDPGYAGKTLVLELYDSAEGSESITVYRPGPSDGLAQIQQGCEYTSYKLREGVSGFASGTNGAGGLIGSGNPNEPVTVTGDCVIPTRSGGRNDSEYYNGRLLEIRMRIPTDYANTVTMCREEVRPQAPQQGDQGCWWSISYKGTGSITDATTWGARIEGDPVRLTE